MGTPMTPSNPSKLSKKYRFRSTSTSVIRRHVSVVTEFLVSLANEEEDQSPTQSTKSRSSSTQPQRKQKLPRSERKALERENKAHKKKNNNGNRTKQQQQRAEDVFKAIKRAQKLHDHHDLRVIGNFLIDECDVGFAYGYRGSLLARLAVAALRWENHNVARRAIEIRRLEYRGSMQPME